MSLFFSISPFLNNDVTFISIFAPFRTLSCSPICEILLISHSFLYTTPLIFAYLLFYFLRIYLNLDIFVIAAIGYLSECIFFIRYKNVFQF